MAIVKTDDQHYTNIADAIREKLEISDTFKPGEMAAAILEISGNDILLVETTATVSDEIITFVDISLLEAAENVGY